MDLRNMSVVVTGASRGLGAALAQELAREGARVVLVARSAEALADVEARIRRAGGEAHSIPADVGDKEAIHQITGAAAALVGPIDLLVNNAGTLGPIPLRLLAETDCEDLEWALAVNLVGPFRLTKALVGSMLLRGKGAVVNITSDAAREAYSGWGAYGVSKAALEHMTRVWARELEGSGVRMVCVDPGEMDTRMHAEALPGVDPATLAAPEEAARAVVSRLRRIEEEANGALLDLTRREPSESQVAS